MGDTRFYFPSLQGLAQASEQTSSLFLKNYYLRLFFVAFIPQAVSFCFFSFSWDVFFSFCAASSSALGTICSFSVRIFSCGKESSCMG